MPVLPAHQPSPASDFQLLRGSMLQEHGLDFTDAIDPDWIRHAFAMHKCVFAEDPACVYTPGVVLWGLLSQALGCGHQRSLQSAVTRIGSLYAQRDNRVIASGTGAYANARKQFDPRVLRTINQRLADTAEPRGGDARAQGGAPGDDALIHRITRLAPGGRIFMIDGFTVTMADTEANQQAWPQNPRQKEGLGFPIARCVALISMTTGLVHDLAQGPYSGKQTGETALFRELFHRLRPGDVVVADSYHCTWWLVQAAQAAGVTVVMKNHHMREDHPHDAERIDAGQRTATWPRPASRPAWMSREAFGALPSSVRIRLVDVEVDGNDRGDRFTIATTALDPGAAPGWWIGDLYRGRWWVELDIRAVKDSMELDHLRAKSPRMVRVELWSTLLAYNLVRLRMMQAAASAERSPRTMGFTRARVCLAEGWVTHATHRASSAVVEHATSVMLGGRVGHRTGRWEPRTVKRRAQPLGLMMEPRRVSHQRHKAAA